jgi:hypothetical protein
MVRDCEAIKESSVIPSFKVVALVLAVSTSTAHADRTADINASLKAFGADSSKAMSQLPVKINPVTGAVLPSRSVFSAEQITSGDFVTIKDNDRKKHCTTVGGARVCLGDLLPGRAPYAEGDQAELLADNGDKLVRSLREMEKKKLRKAALDETPWSDHYWAIFSGQVAFRYADPNLDKSKSWRKYRTYSEKNDFMEIFEKGDLDAIDVLSPAEKYDLLVGDKKGSLTESNWADGESYYKTSGKVEDWMGICHGWAPASYMVARPKHTIELVAADGRTMLNFYPSDIKGLASLLWAKGQNESRFAGARCNDRKPERDSYGRVLSDECFDTNPGTWHLSVVNQIGVSRRSFVIDATYDYEVWNQPVYSYEYSYFNPQTREEVRTLKQATVPMTEFTEDKFKKYRSKDAVAAVGIAMDLTYVKETEPTHAVTDSPDKDYVSTVRYLYDLELDEDGNIIGGEWYHVAHPDFLWTPAPGDLPTTAGDRLVGGHWRGTTPMPETWRKAAHTTSNSAGAPLAKIVKILSEIARD